MGADAGRETVRSQLERERAAVQATRTLLARFPAIKKDLRQLLWSLDNGQAVGLGGVGEPELKEAIGGLMALLALKHTKVRASMCAPAAYACCAVPFKRGR